MGYVVHSIDANYDFVVDGVSYIGNPKKNTAMYVSKKAAYLLNNLSDLEKCLVFAEEGIEISDELKRKNCFVFSDNPQLSYIKFVNHFAEEKQNIDRGRKYKLTEGGYYLGENAIIGYNSYIEPGCVVGHDVVIGSNAKIYAGSVIKNAVIGNDLICNENAVIGTLGFTVTDDEHGNKCRIPTLGHVCIGNNVEVGAHDSIASGTGGDTVIEDYVKIDALVYIGHDVHIGKNVEIVAGSIIGGFADVEYGACIGINSSVRNRITVGKNSMIGMGSNVTKSVENDVTVLGNPARIFVKD